MRGSRPDPGHWLEVRVGAGGTLSPASEDASFRRYFRVDGRGSSTILMDAPPEHENCRPFVDIAARLRAAGVHAPEVLVADPEQGYLLLEDLGDTTYLAGLANPARVDDLYADALATLVRMQGIDPAGMPAYDDAVLRRELALFPQWFLGTHLDLPVPDWLPELEDLLVANALAQPQVFVHRDYHARNLMVTRHDNPGVLDFQDAVRGPVSYDLVSLLRDAYVAWPTARVDGWIAEYRAAAEAAGVDCGPDGDTFRRWFDWMGLQRQLKVAGIFARLYHRDGKAGYLADIPLVLRYARDAAAAYEETSVLARWLETEVLPALEGRP